ncbi:hypothetical protein ACFE04_005851 [Oxalis oulophora]
MEGSVVHHDSTDPSNKRKRSSPETSTDIVVNDDIFRNGETGAERIDDPDKISLVKKKSKCSDQSCQSHTPRNNSEENSNNTALNSNGKEKICASLDVVDQNRLVHNPLDAENNLVYHTIGAPASPLKKKLIILDINGLLADIVYRPPQEYEPDAFIAGRAVFKRPFCSEFLKFCFERFEVGVWSSRTKRNVDRLADYLLGEFKSKLLFCWDQSQCTVTGFSTLDNNQKSMIFKELRKIWEKEEPNLTWETGYFNKSNTLLLDDTPYKALLNPPHTAVFPYSYKFEDTNDNLLTEGGDLRVYLEGFFKAEDGQKYVEQHPFGQIAITEQNASWPYYHQIVSYFSNMYNKSHPMVSYGH